MKETVLAETTPQVVEIEVTRVVTATPVPEPEVAEESGTDEEVAEEPVVSAGPDRDDIMAAITEAEAALEAEPDNATLRYELANLHYQAGQIVGFNILERAHIAPDRGADGADDDGLVHDLSPS